jgi:serine/threonine protein kinase
VWNLRPVVQVLSTTLAFHYHSSDTQNQLTVARHMAAFRKAVRTLKEYYECISSSLSGDGDELANTLSHPALFPYRTEFKSLDDESTNNIRYTEQFQRGEEKRWLIFFGTLQEDPTVQICIKFARRYSKEAHLHCAESGFAPKLRGFEELPGGWYMVVMDKLVGYELLADLPDTDRLPRSVFEAIGEQLKTLHARQLVHGDIRDTNIFVKNDDKTKFMIIDFEWAGVDGVVRYPPYVNYADIVRPDDARDGLLVKAAHDLAMLDVITDTRVNK